MYSAPPATSVTAAMTASSPKGGISRAASYSPRRSHIPRCGRLRSTPRRFLGAELHDCAIPVPGKTSDMRTKQRQRRRMDRAWQRVESLHAVKAADVADGLVAIAVRLFDGVAQLTEVVGIAEHPAPGTFLLEGLVRSHRSQPFYCLSLPLVHKHRLCGQ